MKKLFLILLVFVAGQSAFAQCYPDRHNTSWFDGWISCETSMNPNPAREEGHWIAYDFGRVYGLNELKMWNINDPDLLEIGAKTIALDYSNDGVTWTSYGEINIPMAPGISTYEGGIVANLDGVKARHVLFTVLETYGAEECAGFAEMRFEADSLSDENEDVCVVAQLYPNPFKEQFSIYLEKKCLGDVFYSIEDATGRMVVSETQIQLYETKLIDADQLTPGVYFVNVRNGEIQEKYKIVKA
ncbi:MAG: T9SS type A sorting domain-containing protein [Crocinitomicaceae bacterium]